MNASIDLVTALVLFAFVSSITPGPNNLMLMASGANFGFRRSLPHMLGIGIGFTLMIGLVGVGVMQVLTRYPLVHTALKVACLAYLLWLAWKIAHSAAPRASAASQTEGRPMSFLQAAAFQWVNPKAWAMALTAITVYAPDQTLAAVIGVSLVFGLVNLPCISVWTVIGQQVRRFLTNDNRLRAFNWTMAALLIASVLPMLA